MNQETFAMATIEIKGTVLKIKDVEETYNGLIKKKIHFQPKQGRIFYPEFHLNKFPLLTNIHEGDEVILTLRINGGKTENNHVVASDIQLIDTPQEDENPEENLNY